MTEQGNSNPPLPHWLDSSLATIEDRMLYMARRVEKAGRAEEMLEEIREWAYEIAEEKPS